MAEFLRNSDHLPGRSKATPGCGQPSSRCSCSTGRRTGPNWSTGSIVSAGPYHVPTAGGAIAASAPPRWEFDPDFDLAYHLRRVTAAAPGTIDTLLDMARLAAMADFDRARPLWEVTLIDGLADGGAALLCKLHHALTDGIGAIEIAMTLFDRTERYEKRPMPKRPPTRCGQASGRIAELFPTRPAWPGVRSVAC